MAHHNSDFLLDTLLYCSEEHWEEHEEDDDDGDESVIINSPHSSLIEMDVICNDDEEEIKSLFAKDQHNELFNYFESNPSLEGDRREAVEWMLRVNSHYSFSALTALLAVNYLDRFLFSFRFQNKKPWMTHLAAIACLSLAAKVEETKVPILSDLQVEESRFWFEAKTIKRMEILVLSTLEWKMNPATPLSFIDYMIRRLRLKDHHLCLELFKRCESVLLSLITDSRFMSYLPSVLATATLMHVVNIVKITIDYQSLLSILGINNEEKVDECRKVMLEILEQGKKQCSSSSKMKRKFGWMIPSSPNGVMDVLFSCCDNSSNDSWAVSTSVSVSVSNKKTKTQDQNLLNPFNSDFVSFPPRL